MPADATLNFLKRITSQHRGRPKFIDWLMVHLERINEVDVCAQSFVTEFDLDNARGVQLDILGEILGISRYLPKNFIVEGQTYSVLDDDIYRRVLKSQVLINTWDGMQENLLPAFQSIWPTGNISIKDNQNMSFNLYIDIPEGLQPLDIALINSGITMPKPAGVKLDLSQGLEHAASTLYTTSVITCAGILNINPGD